MTRRTLTIILTVILVIIPAIMLILSAIPAGQPAILTDPDERADEIMREQIIDALGCTPGQASDILVGLHALGITDISDPCTEHRGDGYIYLHFTSGEAQYIVELSRNLKLNRIMDADGNDLYVTLY